MSNFQKHAPLACVNARSQDLTGEFQVKNPADFAMTRRKFLGTATALGAAILLPAIVKGQTAGATQGTPVQSTPAQPPAKKYQAKAPKTQPFGAEAFKTSYDTTIRWLSSAGFFINTRGTTLMIDPLLEGYDMPIMVDMPIMPKDAPHLDAVLITHADTDHYSVATCRDLKPVCPAFHSTTYVGTVMQKDGLPSFGHEIGGVFKVGPTTIKLTPADHDWQNAFPQPHPAPGAHHFEKKDCCGFFIETPDGTIWATGDTRPMPQLLQLPQMDAILLDYSEDAQFHLGLEGSVNLANAYPNTPILLGHWGTVDAPTFTPFNGDPKHLSDRVVNPERIKVLAPGEPFQLKRLKKA
jgi:L-ascorbate metabolism protein UlaG (beta-lactamase superfamily)